jgi:hypothetical protein
MTGTGSICVATSAATPVLGFGQKPKKKKRAARQLLGEDDEPVIPPEFKASIADMEAGRVVPLDVALTQPPPDEAPKPVAEAAPKPAAAVEAPKPDDTCHPSLRWSPMPEKRAKVLEAVPSKTEAKTGLGESLMHGGLIDPPKGKLTNGEQALEAAKPVPVVESSAGVALANLVMGVASGEALLQAPMPAPTGPSKRFIRA